MTTVSANQTSTGLTATSSNPVVVLKGGTAVNTTVSNGGLETVSSGGVESSGTILAGGSATILGSAFGESIYGTQLVNLATAVVTSETVYSGGVVGLLQAGAVGSALTIESGGTVSINGRADALNDVIDGGTLILSSPKAVISGTLTFQSPGGTLQFTALTSANSGGSAFGDQAVIMGFGPNDTIDQTAIAASGATVSFTSANGLLSATISSAGLVASTGTGLEVETFVFGGGITSGNIHVGADATGGIELTYVACFCEGTRILTESGEVAVEDLTVGNRVVTVDGVAEPIRWIGRRLYAGRTLTGRRHLLPIRIKAGALAEATPKRDLLVSPLHAMLIDGALVAAHELVNGSTIVQELAAESVHYVHIELDRHEAIWAEGAASETFVDDHGRFIFQTADGTPVSQPGDAIYCAPRLQQGFQLEAIRRRIARRAELPAA